MYANDTNKESKLVFPKLSYLIAGLCFDVHNELGRFSREKQYGDLLESKLKKIETTYSREYSFGKSGNIIDFVVDKKIILELKAKRILTKDDYYQIQRYLQSTHFKLGLLINFRSRYLKPKRILRLDTNAKNKFF